MIKRKDALDSVGKGWSPLIVCLYKMIDNLKVDYELDIHVEQVKEKFGGLRFYYYESNDGEHIENEFTEKQLLELNNFRSKVVAAEQISLHMCEECGSLGTNANHGHTGWIKTLCTVHAQMCE